MKRGLFTFVFLTFISFNLLADGLVVRHCLIEKAEDVRSRFFLNALKLALDKTESTYGSYKLIPVDLTLNPDRLNNSVKTGRWIDITVSISTQKLENNLLPIKIPLFKGLIGYRLFTINQGDQDRFNAIKDIHDLKQLKAGQNSGWTDTQILKDNGFPVVTSTEYHYLFNMLKKRRFDYFPRSVMEIFDEVQLHDDLAIEENFALYYPAAFYFFVNKANTELAKRLDAGLRMAINDGSYEKELLKHEGFRWAFNELSNNKRKIFTLKNSFSPTNTPRSDPDLWYFSHLHHLN